jgi:hypothetical protein
VSLASASVLTVVLAGTAFAAHCINESKQPGAGTGITVLLNPTTFEPTAILGHGGFADVYIDADVSGTLTAGDIQIEDDVFFIANHSGQPNPAQGVPAILPPILAEMDPGGDGHGVGVGGG